jgi:pyruvate dehydrogenase (quinone)
MTCSGDAAYHAVLSCDVLVLLGADFAWSQFYPSGAAIIQIDVDPTHRGRCHPVTIGAVGNIKTILGALRPRLEQHEDGRFLEAYVDRFRKDLASAKAETVSDADSAISGTYLTRFINKHAAEDTLLAADGGRRQRSGCCATSIPAANAEPLPAWSTARSQVGFHQRSDCKSASLAGK